MTMWAMSAGLDERLLVDRLPESSADLATAADAMDIEISDEEAGCVLVSIIERLELTDIDTVEARLLIRDQISEELASVARRHRIAEDS